MNVTDLKTYVETQISYNKYVMNMFHKDTPDNCCAVILSSAGRSDRNTGTLLFQFLIRNSDPELAEQTASSIYDFFNNKTEYVVGTKKVIMSRGQQAVPLYTGIDELERHIYSVNVEAIVDNQ